MAEDKSTVNRAHLEVDLTDGLLFSVSSAA